MESVKVIQWILWSAFYLACPALLLFLCKRVRFFKAIGEVILAYAVGILLGNTIITKDYTPLLEGLSYLTILIAIPLMLFSVNIRSLKSLAGKTILSFALALIALIIVVVGGFFLFNSRISEAPAMAGMLIGVYTGGTVNIAAIGKALQASNHLFITISTVDILVGLLYFVMLASFGKNVLARFLPAYKHDKTLQDETPSPATLENKRKSTTRLILMVGITILIDLLAAAIIGFRFDLSWQMAVFILAITSFSIITGSFNYVHQTRGTFELGYYLVLSFCLIIGSMANLEQLLTTSGWVFLYVALAVFGTLTLHILLSKLFRIDRDTTIITSIAMIFSPPFVPVMAGVLKNRNIILPGIATGVLGYAIGNYLGIAVAYLLEVL